MSAGRSQTGEYPFAQFDKLADLHIKKRSIYGQQSQELLRIYEEAGTARKVLVGAIDCPHFSHFPMDQNGKIDLVNPPLYEQLKKEWSVT